MVPRGKQENHICHLHRWAANCDNAKQNDNKMSSGARHHVCKCKACEENLCLNCYEIFHTKDDLEAETDTILSVRNDRKMPGNKGG